ncbi:MAG: tRNA (adenosine(37)-N6)-dimethylallyltransferase MiaA [Oscillospiraceae bacterium]|nr:tRNA (adenosine(37)-N6)-dimethylallyltransferase MiaA [Oscillospiraceae bacterium]
MARVLCVVGPTATGKTKMGVALAHRFNGEVVSVDSMQLYRGMEVGTAAPTAQETEGIPHHMVGIADPAENWSVAKYVAEADRCVQDILSRGKLPVLVGGTGLYLDALIRGTDFAAGEQDGETRRRLQQRMEAEGAKALLAELHTIDPRAAEKLHLKDEKRIIRALEVYYETGQTITEHDAETKLHPPRYEALYIGLDFENRDDLRSRIDRRVDVMVEQGLLQEVRQLLASDADRCATAWQAIGYKQFLAVADGTATVDEAVEEVKLRSRQYAKRQLTWLRRNENIFWVRWEKEPNFPAGFQKATEYLLQNGLG